MKLTLLILSLFLIFDSSSFAERRKKRVRIRRTRASIPFYRIQYNSLIGLQVFNSQGAVVSGGQFAWAPFKRKRFYIGPEVTYALFDPGAVTTVGGGLWYEWKLFKPSTLRLGTGVLVGAGFTDGLPTVSPTELISLFDLTLVRDLNNTVSIRAQLRPGIFDKRFTWMANFNMSFRLHPVY